MSYFIFHGVIFLKKEDFDYLYKQLEELEAEVERLKRENPDDDYQELDETVDKFRQMISDENIKQYKRNMMKRRLLSNFFNFIFHLIVTFSVLGFCFIFLNNQARNYIVLVVLGLALLVYNYRKLSKALVFGGPLKNHKLIYTVVLYFLFSCSVGIIDFFITHLWTSIWECVLTLVVLGIVLDIGEFIFYRKLVMKYKQGGRNE